MDLDLDLDSGSDSDTDSDTGSDSSPNSDSDTAAETDADAFDELLAFVEAELNFATSHYNDSYLDRRISSRMRRTQTDSYTEYADLLHSDSDEQESLLESFSINVTGFFRNPEVWDGIRQILRHCSARRQHTDQPLRIWSAACADGREPYSLSLLAQLDPKIDADAVEILGTDISEPALETARNGVYEEPRTVDLDEQLSFLEAYDEGYEQYVEHQGRTYELGADIRQSVTFERHDLINGEPKSTANFDLVVCRNLFIYIDNEFKRPILQTIARSLTDDGFLVIGKAETIPPSLKSAFEVRDARRRIYQCDNS
ncbi:CheR family methyltransferase [Natrialba sp. SSL1]|uniref:CheR family methyltransferase n=1 Tax=Natrialba sp. SSL1 TaxID=1869245 RepID=UPI00373FC76C